MSPPLRRLKLTKLPLDTSWAQLNTRHFPSAGILTNWRALVHNRGISLDDFSRAGEVKELLLESIKLGSPLDVIRYTSWGDLSVMHIEDFWTVISTYFRDEDKELYRKLHRAYKNLGLTRTPSRSDFIRMMDRVYSDNTPLPPTPARSSKEDWMATTLKKAKELIQNDRNGNPA